MNMNSNKKNTLKKNLILTASGIGQYQFCSVSWYLQKCGYKPESSKLKIGKIKHKKLGKIIINNERKYKTSKILKYISYFLIILSFLLIISEVIL